MFCLPCGDKFIRGETVWMTGAVLLASFSQSVGVCGPTIEVTSGACFPRSLVEPGSRFQGSNTSLVSIKLSLGRPDSGNSRVGTVTVSIGGSSCKVEDDLRSATL